MGQSRTCPRERLERQGDHIYGTCLFDGAEIVSQDICRDVLATHGQGALDRAKRDNPALAEVELRLPQVTFQHDLHLHVGNRHMHLMHTPGHTSDSICLYTMDDKVLIAGDTMMPVPHIVKGNYELLIESLQMIKELKPNFIIQGHGDVLLRGEIDEAIDANIAYLHTIVDRVQRLLARGEPMYRLRDIDIESCGLSRVPLDGLVSKLHVNNLVALYRKFSQGGE